MEPTYSRTKALLHPVRARITVMLNDRPLTPRQMALLMEDVPLGTLYRHLNILQEAGIIEVVRERRIHGTLERQFALAKTGSLLSEEDRQKLTEEDVVGLVAALTGVVQATFNRYVRAASMPPRPGEVSLLAQSLYLTREEYQAFREQVIALHGKRDREPGAEHERRLIAFFSAPDPEPDALREDE